MRLRRGVLVVGMVASACSPQAAPPPHTTAPVIRITQPTFEPVYRASKSVQGAVGSGVTYVKFGELCQALMTEIGIAKDHQLSPIDQKLIAVYEKAFDVYQASGAFWKARIDESSPSSQDRLHGRILVCIQGKCGETSLGILADKYSITLEPVDPTSKIMVAPADTIQLLWKQADALLLEATDVYYGRREPL